MESERYSRTKKATKRATFFLIALGISLIGWLVIAQINKISSDDNVEQISQSEMTPTEGVPEMTPEPTNTPIFPTATPDLKLY